MMTNNKKKENELIGNILTDDVNDTEVINPSTQVFGYNRSTSAPPPGLNDLKTTDAGAHDALLSSPGYYQYYYSLKPLDPRLPKPLWKPGMPTVYTEPQNTMFTQGNKDQEDEGEEYDEQETATNFTNKGSTSDKMSMDSLSNQMNQNLNIGKKDQDLGNKDIGQKSYSAPYNQNQGYQQNQFKPRNQQNFQKPQNTMYQQQFPTQFQQGGGGFYPQQNMQMGMNMYQKPFPQQQPTFPFQQPNFNVYQPQMQTQMGGFPMMPNMYQQGFQMNNPNQFMMQQDMSGMQRFGMPYQQNTFQKFGGGGGFQGYNNQMQGNMGGNMQGQWNQGYNQNTQNTKPFYQGGQNKGDRNFQKGGIGFKSGSAPTQSSQMTKQDITQIMQRIVENCQDQNGSRMIQQHFESASDEDREKIFSKVLPEATKLMKDVFGNYVIQKIFEKGSLEQKKALFDALEGEVYNLSVNTYGCRVIQKALEEFKSDYNMQKKIIDELRDRVQECIEDQNGNHVIQKMFETIPNDKLDFIVKVVVDNLDTLAFHPFGCRVIQKILENVPESKTSVITKKLMQNCVKLCECQYGNYIMQHILEKPSAEKTQLLNVLRDNFVALSLNKFASNVTEKSVIFGTAEYRKEVLDVLLSNTGNPNDQPLLQIMCHQFGNYVIQRLFECGDINIKTKIYNRIKTYDHNQLRQNQYGKHVLSFIEKQMDDIQKF